MLFSSSHWSLTGSQSTGSPEDNKKGFEGFFKVKRANEKRTLDWAKAIDRKNQFGGLWMPSKSTIICANHFLDGKPSDDSGSPDYIPSKNMPSKKIRVCYVYKEFLSVLQKDINYISFL